MFTFPCVDIFVIKALIEEEGINLNFLSPFEASAWGPSPL
jgi:hypothetical protein